ncbi:MAG: Aldose 1-epimerase [uncultured Nocardioidaceae bacterium]|uniref:Aldose 1-epimerase n=1 Tax=uncultured Nocardioidaceae bacterium TaxID=253824 RepID=A0A6J4NCP5_9ACTN|nr:MAG: Aldose 1-epimerase [uncultured Nocardioidaceae bacterium]
MTQPGHTATSAHYGTLSHGDDVDLVRLASDTLQVDVITWGARVVSILAPDRDGVPGEVTLGLADLAAYEQDRRYFGPCVGRFANRIAGGAFELDGRRHQLPTNEGPTTLHGGPEGFDRRLWQAELGEGASVRLHRVSDDGEMGFPGRLEVSVHYELDGSDLRVGYDARASAPTLVNLTNHTYFNLAGAGVVEDHVVRLDGDRYLPVDAALNPTGELRPVDATPFDLRTPVRLGDRLRSADHQLSMTRGFDHTWVLVSDDALQRRAQADTDVAQGRAARVEHPQSGRWLEVWTDRPGVQFYSGNFLDGTVVGREGTSYRQGDAFCLEPHHFPDAPHHEHFPSVVLRPGDVYRARDVYRFGTQPPAESS